MTGQAADDVTGLMAYADGEMSPEAAAEVEARLVHDAEARRLVALFLTDRRRIAGIVDEAAGRAEDRSPPPAGPETGRADRDGPAMRVAVARRRPGRVPGRDRLVPRALAGGVVAALVAVGTAGGFLAGRAGGPETAAFPGVPGRVLSEALETLPNGAPHVWRDPVTGAARTLTPTVTYVTTDGRFCREIEQIAADRPESAGGAVAYAVACRDADGWRTLYWIIETPPPGARTEGPTGSSAS